MENKNFLVVGSSSGIGAELARKLLSEGAMVWGLSRTRGENPDHLRFRYLAGDVSSESLALDSLPEALNGIAYCPGSIRLKPFRSLQPDHFREDFELNVLGAVRVLQACYPALRKAETAGVVLFSTVAVGQGMSFHASIASAKGAVEGLVRSLAAEWAPRIRVNGIAPSLTDTPLAAQLLSTPEKKEASALRHPLKKIGESADIANMAHFLLSEEAGWISGQIIGVDGGLSSLRV